jgi:acyl CoA:acetate/3-ketoacid CoA transferase
MRKPILSAAEAVAAIPDSGTLVVEGSGGGLLEPDLLLRALRDRFLTTGHPRDLTLVHCTGIGDRAEGGLGHLAHDGLIRRVVAGNWAMAPAMGRMALEGRFEAYNFPQGVMSQLFREVAAGRPGLITHVGLHTFVDPRYEGGKLNAVTTEDLVELITIHGREWLLYRTFPIDAAFIRGTTIDEEGNLSLEEEAARLEVLAVAQATHNAGGTVIAQAKRLAVAGSLPAQSVVVPGFLIDAIVLHPAQWQTVQGEYNPSFSGRVKTPLHQVEPLPLTERKVVARRAFQELHAGAVVNLGVGMADGVAAVAAEEGFADRITLTVEQGVIGGIPAKGVIFGVSHNPTAFVDQPYQFDFYDGGGLDVTCLGCGEIDPTGNVNVSKFGDKLIGTGGFVNISQNAKKVVFCSTFTAGGLEVVVADGGLRIAREGRFRKFRHAIEQVTFNARYGLGRGQEILYVTERAVFAATTDGLLLTEIAPGVGLQRDILDQMDFRPLLPPGAPTLMDSRLFRPELLSAETRAGTLVAADARS